MNQKYEFVHNFMLDSCGFDASDPKEKCACEQILAWEEAGVVVPIIPHSVLKEIEHPRTPRLKKERARGLVSTYDLGLNAEQRKKIDKIKEILAGKGEREKYGSDALHVLIAHDSADYFITADNRLISRRREVENILLGMKICKPSEFVDIVKKDKEQWGKRNEWRRRMGLPPD